MFVFFGPDKVTPSMALTVLVLVPLAVEVVVDDDLSRFAREKVVGEGAGVVRVVSANPGQPCYLLS
jgi:hypothetical protein